MEKQRITVGVCGRGDCLHHVSQEAKRSEEEGQDPAFRGTGPLKLLPFPCSTKLKTAYLTYKPLRYI